MSLNSSGKKIWLSSLSELNYLLVECRIDSELDVDTIVNMCEKEFLKLDWPCGKASFSENGSDSFFCIDTDKKIGFIYLIDKEYVGGELAIDLLDKMFLEMKISLQNVNDKLLLIDSKIKLFGTKTSIQRALQN